MRSLIPALCRGKIGQNKAGMLFYHYTRRRPAALTDTRCADARLFWDNGVVRPAALAAEARRTLPFFFLPAPPRRLHRVRLFIFAPSQRLHVLHHRARSLNLPVRRCGASRTKNGVPFPFLLLSYRTTGFTAKYKRSVAVLRRNVKMEKQFSRASKLHVKVICRFCRQLRSVRRDRFKTSNCIAHQRVSNLCESRCPLVRGRPRSPAYDRVKTSSRKRGCLCAADSIA